MAGMCVRSARKWQDGPLPSETKEERWWRTRPDPFDGVWEEEVEPLLQGDPKGKLKACCRVQKCYRIQNRLRATPQWRSFRSPPRRRLPNDD